MPIGEPAAVVMASRADVIRALRIVGPERLEFTELPVPPAGPGQALAAPAYVGLCGTDLELLAGTMPYFSAGNAWFPLQPGHEWSGTVLRSDDPPLAPGQPVVMDPIVGCGRCARCASGPRTRCQERQELGVRNGLDGALATVITVPGENLVPVPPSVALREAVLVEPLVTVLAGIERAAPQVGEEALVVGAGTLGLLATMVLRSRGLRTHVLLRDPVRRPTVEEAGAEPWLVGERSVVADFDVVIEAAGTTEAIARSLELAGPGGRVALLGVPVARVEVDVAHLVLHDVAVHGVLSGPGWFGAALEAICSGAVRPEVVIDRVFAFEEVEAAFERAREPGRARPKVLVQVEPDATGAVS